jgi:hypothetical protein
MNDNRGAFISQSHVRFDSEFFEKRLVGGQMPFIIIESFRLDLFVESAKEKRNGTI